MNREITPPFAEGVGSTRCGSRPAMMPAMCVPWPNASIPSCAELAPEYSRAASNERSGPLTRWPASYGRGATPVSITATSTPAPV